MEMPALSVKRKCGPLEIFEKTKNNPDPKTYPVPHTSRKNQKQEQVSQVKDKLPFGLKNVGVTFQRAMSYAFHDIKHIV